MRLLNGSGLSPALGRALLALVLCSLLPAVQAIAMPIDEDEDPRSTTPLDQKVQGRAIPSTSLYNSRFPGVTWDNAKWQLNNTQLNQGHYQSRSFVANGYHGINVAALGPFFEADTPVDGDNINGWPLFARRQTFATVGGFWDSQPTTNESNFPWLYQYGWDSAISGIPHWGGITLDLGGGKYLDASTDSTSITDYSAVLDMKQATMSWAYTWTPAKTNDFQIAYQIFAHRLHPNQGLVAMNVTSKIAKNVTIVNVLNGDCAVRTDFKGKGIGNGLISSAVSPNGVHNVTAYVYAGMVISGATSTPLKTFDLDQPYLGNNKSSNAQAFQVELQAGKTATIYKYVGIASSDGFTNPGSVAENAAMAALTAGYQRSLQTHVSEWSGIFSADFIDDYSFPENGSLPSDPYLVESAIVAVANPYHLLQNTLSQNAVNSVNGSINSHGISVGGLASDSYAGQVFWDADIWMQPGIVASFPFEARGISNYRAARLPQAKANVGTAYQSSMKNAHFSPDAAVYSWTSGRYSNCTATGPCFDYEYHINGDIAHELVNYWIASGDTDFFKTDLFPVYDSIAIFLSNILHKNGSQYELLNMTDPDEYANNVDNGGYTMALISNTLKNANNFRAYFGQAQNSTWAAQAQNIFIGRNENAGITLEYSGMNGSVSVKQADVVLNTYPLSYTGNNDSYDSTNSLSDLDWYAAKQSPDGPGMTYAIFSIDANQVSPSGCASYTYQQYSERPYMRGPWYQFSEQLVDDFTVNGGTHPAYPFMTGHGGAYQVVLYGYLGLRYLPDWHLHVDPALPPQIPQLRYRTFYWQGWPISAFSNQTHTTLKRVSTTTGATSNVRNQTFASMPIPIIVGDGASAKTYSLSNTGTVVIANRMIGTNQTIPGNVAQCRTVTSPDDYVPGQFPISAIDGAASTKWQPALANQVSSITVSLIPGLKIDHFEFDWAQAPPRNITITFSNSTASMKARTNPISMSSVKVSEPYQANKVATIVPYASNTTTWKPEVQVYTSKYMSLSIYGNQVNGAGKMAANLTGATVAEWAIVVLGENGKQEEAKRELVNERRSSGQLSGLRAKGRRN